MIGVHVADCALSWILAGFSFAMGAAIASFLNVVIWRVPRGESIVSPPSHCPKCNAPIHWYQNIPILSWLALRGKCASCKAPISPRYILVETLGGILFTLAYWRLGVIAPLAWIWISLAIVGSFIDFDLQLLPDFVTVGGMILGVALSVLCSFSDLPLFYAQWPLWPQLQPFDLPLVNSLVGLAVGFGLLWAVRFLGSKAFKREAMGLGDVFLMGAIGALCGPFGVLVTLIVSSVIGSVVGLGLMLAAKAKLGSFVAIPFGPYLVLGSLVWMYAAPELVRAYLIMIGVSPV